MNQSAAFSMSPHASAPVRAQDGSKPRTAALLLFLSGIPALVFQVLWIKQIALVVGVDIHAVTITISGFFAGLAAGSALIGRIADRHDRPLRLYAWLELAIGVLGIAITLIMPTLAAPFARLEDSLGATIWAGPFVLVALPAFFMGGTLPAMMRVLSQDAAVSRNGGGLYAANTCGAVIGALLTSFALIPLLGLSGAACAAASLNLVAAVIAWRLSSQHIASTDTGADTKNTLSRDAVLALALYAIAGGVALGYEVVWTQALVPFMSTRAFAFSVVLATYLVGLVIGSALYARHADKVRNPWGVFGILIAAAGFSALLGVACLGQWLPFFQGEIEKLAMALTHNRLAAMSARFAFAATAIMLLPALILGAAFPAALRLVACARHAGRDTGALLALNTLGGIAGTLLTGFVLLPHLGLLGTLTALGLTAALLGIFAALRGTGLAARLTTSAIAVLVVATSVATPSSHLVDLLAASRGGVPEFYEEGAGGTVAVLQQYSGSHGFRRLYIQGVSNSGDTMGSQRYMRLQALLPLIIHNGEPRSAMVIGFGTGITAGALLAYTGLDKRVAAELLPSVVRASSLFEGNYGASTDPRLDIHLRDGRRELLANPQQYDLITLEPPPPSAAGVANLYSTDFYRLAASRLNRHGIVAQWLPLPTQNVDDTRSLVKSFIDVFPHASLWTTELHEMLLVGSMDPIELDAARISQRFAQPDVAHALSDVGIDSPAALLATWVTDRAGLVRFAGDAKAVTDNDPRIEYADWVRSREILATLPCLLDVRTDVPLSGAGADTLRPLAAAQRDSLLAFYEAGLAAYADDREHWLRSMDYVHRTDPNNPYYRWVAGAS